MTLDRRLFLKTAGVASTAAALPAAGLTAAADTTSDTTAGTATEATRRGGGVRLAEPLVEKKTSPLGIDVDRPRFSWTVESRQRGVDHPQSPTLSPRPSGRSVFDSTIRVNTTR